MHIRYQAANHAVTIICADCTNWSRQIQRYNNSPPYTWRSIWPPPHSVNTGAKGDQIHPLKFLGSHTDLKLTVILLSFQSLQDSQPKWRPLNSGEISRILPNLLWSWRWACRNSLSSASCPTRIEDGTVNLERRDKRDNPLDKDYNQIEKSGLRGNCTNNQKLVCFVLYLTIINTFSKNNACILNCSRNTKWHYNFSRPSSL